MRIAIIVFLFSIPAGLFAQPCYGDYSCTGKKRTKFHLPKEKIVAGLRTDGVYMTKEEYSGNASGYSFFRFFDDGSAFRSCGYCSAIPDSLYDRFIYGNAARYIIRNDTVVLEYFSAYQRYHYDYYLLKNGELISIGYGMRKLFKHITANKGDTLLFYRMKLTARPDW